MDDFKPELMKALLDWLNTFDLAGRVTTWAQLEDGQILWQILSDIDAEYFNESLPNFEENHRRQSVDWIPRWQNLKHIERTVSTYIREECEQLPVLTKRMIPDLKTGARDGSTMLVAKLTMAVLLASCFSPKSNQRMLQVMSRLGTKTAETIAGAIQDMQSLDQRMSELGVDAELTPEVHIAGYRTPTRAMSGAQAALGGHSELEQEAQLFEANKDRQAMKVQIAKLKDELKTSRERIAKLEEEVAEASAYLDVRAGQAQRAQSDDVEQLRNDLARDRQYIDQLETDLASSRDIMESQKRRLDRLQGEEGSKQDLRDQLQMVKAERDELSQRAKANENLKKKIESLTKETKQLETLREEHQIARERLAELENVQERCEALEKVYQENSQTLVNCEQAIFEEKGKRTRVEHENLLLMKQFEQTRELQYKAEDARQDLEDRIRELEAASHVDGSGNLEDELTQDGSVKISDDLARPGDTRTSADVLALQQKVDILQARLKSLETETLKQMQENLGLRSDMMTERNEENQRPFLEQNEKLQTAETELGELHRKLREKDLEVAELRNELNKKSDVSEDEKADGLQAEHEHMLAFQAKTNQRLRELEIINDEKTSLLRAALLDRDHLSPELLDLKRIETLRHIRERIDSVLQAPEEAQAQVLDEASTEIAETVLSAEVALEKAKKDLEEQVSENGALRHQLEEAKKETSDKGSAESQQAFENLRRENDLMKSAWYDMVSRLQSNTVVLQRRSEAPKGWIGKQRAAVGRGTGIVGRR